MKNRLRKIDERFHDLARIFDTMTIIALLKYLEIYIALKGCACILFRTRERVIIFNCKSGLLIHNLSDA